MGFALHSYEFFVLLCDAAESKNVTPTQIGPPSLLARPNANTIFYVAANRLENLCPRSKVVGGGRLWRAVRWTMMRWKWGGYWVLAWLNFSLNRFCAALSKKTNTANLSLSPCQKFFLPALAKKCAKCKNWKKIFPQNGFDWREVRGGWLAGWLAGRRWSCIQHSTSVFTLHSSIIKCHA